MWEEEDAEDQSLHRIQMGGNEHQDAAASSSLRNGEMNAMMRRHHHSISRRHHHSICTISRMMDWRNTGMRYHRHSIRRETVSRMMNRRNTGRVSIELVIHSLGMDTDELKKNER